MTFKIQMAYQNHLGEVETLPKNEQNKLCLHVYKYRVGIQETEFRIENFMYIIDDED